MSKFFGVAVLSLSLFCLPVLSACHEEELAQSSSVTEAQPLTEVLVLGMIHSGHRESKQWGLDQVRETIRRMRPDVVCAEIPPARWPVIWREYSQVGTISDSRVLRFPEYTDVLLPLKKEIGFEVEGCAGWTQEMSDARRLKLQELETLPELAELNTEFQRREKLVEARHAADPIDEDDPRVIHSTAYDERTRESLAAYDELLNDYLGPGGWTNINRSHWRLIEQSLARHRGQRILITFGAGHKYWFLDRLREVEGVRLVDVGPFLPTR